jgi:hypothetical protein
MNHALNILVFVLVAVSARFLKSRGILAKANRFWWLLPTLMFVLLSLALIVYKTIAVKTAATDANAMYTDFSVVCGLVFAYGIVKLVISGIKLRKTDEDTGGSVRGVHAVVRLFYPLRYAGFCACATLLYTEMAFLLSK